MTESPPKDIEVGLSTADSRTDDRTEDGLEMTGRESGSIRSITQDDIDVDEARIRRAVQETGVFSFGIVGVEAWLLNEEDGTFVCPDGGSWTNHVLKFHNYCEDSISKIFDPTHPEYLPPVPQIAGTGIAGYFWSLGPAHTGAPEKLLWRDLRAVTSDPDQPPSPRMAAMVRAGIGMAAGVPFDILGRKGIVIFMARNNANTAMLNDEANAEYLQFCAQYIGGAACLTMPRQLSLESKRMRLQACFRRIVTKISIMHAFQHAAEDAKSHRTEKPTNQDDHANETGFSLMDALRKVFRCIKGAVVVAKEAVVAKGTTLIKKSKGSNTQPPPSQSFFLAILAFIGSFTTLILIYGLAQLFETLTEDRYTILLGPLVSLMCAQYALTAAPASQPRNAIYGQIVSVCGAYLCRLLLNDLAGGPQWLVSCLAGALSVFSMAKLGVVHPPAAGAAFFFANSEYNFHFFLLVLFGNFVAIGMAIIINNWTDKRQYPVYWQFGFSRAFAQLERFIKKPKTRNDDDEQAPGVSA